MPNVSNTGSAGELRFGRYSKADAFGTGPLGQVYRGKQLSTGVDVAVKELKDILGYFSFLQRSEVMKRLKKEICRARPAVRHPSRRAGARPEPRHRAPLLHPGALRRRIAP